MRFTLTVEPVDVQTGNEVAEILVRLAPTVERLVGNHLSDCSGAVRDSDGRKVGKWAFVRRPVPDSVTRQPTLPKARSFSEIAKKWMLPAATTNTNSPTVRDINEHLGVGSHACYVNTGNERIRIRHVRKVNGQLQGKSLNRPGEWITIPPDATFELRD